MNAPHTPSGQAPDRNHLMALMRALEWLKAKEFTRAEGIGLRVAEADPNNADAHFVSAVAAYELGNHRVALSRLDVAIDLQPKAPEFYSQRGVVLSAMDCREAAVGEFCRSLELNPSDVPTLANLARLLLKMGDPHQAYRPMRRALALQPDDPELLGDMAVILVACRQPSAALPLYEQAIRLVPGDAELHCNYSRALLMLGQYTQGWRENEWRWHSNHYRKSGSNLPAPEWDGSPVESKTILIVCEQGFGDALQFIRYVPWMRQQGATVLVQCRPELARLFQAVQGVERVIPMGEPLPEIDLAIPMLSLPLVHGTRIDTIPAARCLSLPAEPAPPLPIRKGNMPVRVGLVWSGNNQRTMCFEDLAPLLKISGIEFHSLQLGPESQKARDRGLIDWSGWLTDFASTAAVMSRLDLVITIDTSTAHLAGSLGIPAWVLIHATADWRWGATGERTPWYPDVRLFRQEQPGQWAGLIGRVSRALQRQAVLYREERRAG
ncbi:MAG: glycosyltransferase family protein [Magnetococcales bacterium]|nr:glycosyltransferase family protein [Magnetococcales bacterium]